MPKKIQKSKYKPRHRANPRNMMTSTRAPIAKAFRTALRYCGDIRLNPSAGSQGTAGHDFVANSLFEPDLSGTSHQPMGFDQIMTLYDHYTVLGSKITVQFNNLNDNIYTCGITLQDDVGTTASITETREHPQTVFASLGSVTGKSTLVLTNKFSTKRFFNRKHPVDDSDLRGDAATIQAQNPIEQAIYNIWAIAAGGIASDPLVIDANVTIDYISVFTEPKRLAGS